MTEQHEEWNPTALYVFL